MASYGLRFALILLSVQTCAVYGHEEIVKSSLSFVIDDTASMSDEIRQVKEEVNIIFEKVLSSKVSQIENFVLVTFNDPTTQLRTITKDRNEFKRAVADISVHGGSDCPEYPMSGIELALKESLPLSYLYVFTDASAKDYYKYDQIKSISQRKQSQVVFILTGECGSRSGPDYQVFHKVAEATNGQVFHMMKDDVKDILKFIEESITGREIPLVNKKFKPGYDNTIEYPVDSHTGIVTISVTGDNPVITGVRGPSGSKPSTEPFINKPNIAIVKVKNSTIGTHKVEVGSSSDTHVMVTAKSDLNIQLGFSVYRPNSMKDTVTRPAPEGNAFLGVRLLGSGVTFTTAKILDMNDNVIAELPLELIDDKTQFYITPSFNPPFTMFRVAISGNDVATKSPIARTSPTPIERQNPSTLEEKENRAPKVTIDGAPTIITEYNAPLRLKCNVHGYPAPDITWEEKDTGIRIPAEVQAVEIPYDYVSIMDINKANKNVTYQCKASNTVGVNIEYVQVETKRKIYFDVTEAPKDTKVEYNKEGSLVCKVDAYPPASITWYKDGVEVFEDSNIDISNDKSILTLKYMQVELQGKYTCEARNNMGRKVFIAQVTIFGVEKPVIDKSHKEVRVIEKTNAALSCRMLKGIPKPKISWSFRPAGEDTFRVMAETKETIYVNNVGQDQTGSYECSAQNVLGSDTFTIELVVEYPPTIKEDLEVIISKDDDEVGISCNATGEPVPAVRWFFNNTRFDSTKKSRISIDQSLRFKARLADTGYYRCEAANKLGNAKKTAFLNVYVPVTIETPKQSTIEVMVGKSKMLNCRADGYPKPNIKWTFQGLDTMIPAKDITPPAGVASLALRNMQLDQQGLYTCEAENGFGEAVHITYDVKIYAPPVIHNTYTTKAFEAVTGDPTLRIRCTATGSPKPSIVWIKNGLNLAIGSDWYSMEDDGTLVIKNIERSSEGVYVCHAQNTLGNDTEAYEVIVRDSLIPESPTNTVFVPEGDTIDIKCDIPHKSTDQIRWYKGGVAIALGELTLYSVTRGDDGLYTCRVSDAIRSRSATTKVVIGFKPTFTTKEEDTIDFVHGADLEFLSCEAYGEPRPKTAIWKHNGKKLDTTNMSYPLSMEYGATGIYECEVSNEFGSINRTFTVTSRDCILDIKKDFPEKQPIMYSPSLGWPEFKVEDGYMIISHQDYFYFNCPSNYSNPNLPVIPNLMAFCVRDNKIKIYGKEYKFADIQCKKEVKPQVLRTGNPCLPGDTETVNIGYRLFTEFIGVYDVCLDKKNNMPLFTKHRISPDHTDRSIKPEWGNTILPQDFDTLYDCRRQAYDISMALGRGLSTLDSCCFGRRQLVNSRDLRPGVPTSAANDYLNVIPHWSTCNSKNWEDVEQSVRNLVKSAGRDLVITTGTANPRHAEASANITLYDGRKGQQTVAPYLWKVVQDPAQQASLAIIQVNIPELSEEEALKHVLCTDICGNFISWIEPSNYLNVDDGYTYCCSITEFEKAFGYIGRFSPLMKRVLFDGYRMPDFYLAKK